MAKKRKKAKAASGESEVGVTIPVPQGAKIKVTNLKDLSADELADALKEAKTASVGFVILNAPFKVGRTEPVA